MQATGQNVPDFATNAPVGRCVASMPQIPPALLARQPA